MNKVIFMGRLTKDPETRSTSDGKALASFSIAVDRKYKREGQPDADFFNCTAFGKIAEFVSKYFTKGQKIAIVGSLQNDSYEKDGAKHYVTRVLVDEVEFCESKGESKKEVKTDSDGFMNVPDGSMDDLPFN